MLSKEALELAAESGRRILKQVGVDVTDEKQTETVAAVLTTFLPLVEQIKTGKVPSHIAADLIHAQLMTLAFATGKFNDIIEKAPEAAAGDKEMIAEAMDQITGKTVLPDADELMKELRDTYKKNEDVGYGTYL